MQDEANQSKKDTMYLAFDMTGKDMILYFADGDKQANEIIFEVAQVGKSKVAKYTKNAISNAFKKDKNTKKKLIAKEAFNMMSLLDLFGFGGAMGGITSQMKYKKCADETSELFGEVYVYELVDSYDKDESYGYIRVDKETGIWVRLLDVDGAVLSDVQEIKTDDYVFPEYK